MSSKEASKKTAGEAPATTINQILNKGAGPTEENILTLTIISQAEDNKPNKHHKLEKSLLEHQQQNSVEE